MQTEFVHVGYGGTIAINRVLAIASPESAPIKRMIRQANKEGRIINLTYGRKAKTVIVLDSGHIALAAFQPNIILRRINEYRARGGGLLDLTLDDEQPSSDAEQEGSSVVHSDNTIGAGSRRRADDVRRSAGEEKMDE